MRAVELPLRLKILTLAGRGHRAAQQGTDSTQAAIEMAKLVVSRL